ncbi:MAG: hypothetical protein RLY43_171 [Bacteroidota bacterium]|jgi:hypothetical protein
MKLKEILCHHDFEIRYILPYIKENKILISCQCKKCGLIIHQQYNQSDKYNFRKIEYILEDLFDYVFDYVKKDLTNKK